MTQFRKGQKVMFELNWAKEDFADCSGKIAITDDKFARLPARAKARITRCHRSGTFDLKLLERPGGFWNNVEASRIYRIAEGQSKRDRIFKMVEYKFHEFADLFPLPEGDEFAELVDDIKANGLRSEILLCNGKILDGRNRYRACLAAGIEPLFKRWHFMGDEGDPRALDYVISANLRRRHLSESQREVVAAKIATLGDGQRQVGKFASVPTQAKAAEMLNVSARSVRSARTVLDKGAPELVTAVDSGKIKVSSAAAVARLPKAEQREVMAAGPKAVVGAARAKEKDPPSAEVLQEAAETILIARRTRQDLQPRVSTKDNTEVPLKLIGNFLYDQAQRLKGNSPHRDEKRDAKLLGQALQAEAVEDIGRLAVIYWNDDIVRKALFVAQKTITREWAPLGGTTQSSQVEAYGDQISKFDKAV